MLRRPLAIALLATTLCATLSACDGSSAPTTATVTAGGKPFSVRLALDDPSREKGLSGVATLGEGEGMLFVFPDSQTRNFWMVDCLMDIDIAFVNPLGFVTSVHTMPKEPLQAEGETRDDYYKRLPRYPSIDAAQFALEVAPGTLSKLGVKRGTRLEFDRDSLKTHAK